MSQPAVNTALHVVEGLPHNVPAYLPVNSFQSHGGSHNYVSNNNDYGNNNGYESYHYGANDNGHTGFGSHYGPISITFSKKPFLGNIS